MPNVFKYAPGATAPGTLKKGDFLIGNNTADYGGTYYTGITPVTGGYTIYQNKPTGGPAINYALNDAEMIQYTFLISNQSFATGPSALNWYNTQSDKVVVNMDYEPITTSGLVLNLDAGFTPSYPKGGSGWYDLGPSGLTGQLINSPTFSSSDGGSIVFDGVDDYISSIGGLSSFSYIQNTGNATISIWALFSDSSLRYIMGNTPTSAEKGFFIGRLANGSLQFQVFNGSSNPSSLVSYTTASGIVNDNNWNNYSFVLDKSSNVVNVYKNGILASSGGSVGLLSTGDSTRSLTLGVINNFLSNFFSGRIAQTLFYNRVLSSSDIFQNYQAFLTRIINPGIVTNGMVLYLDAASPFYAGSGTLWADASGNKNTGTLVNGPTYATGNGGAIVFDGVDDYVTCGTTVGNFGTSNFTINFFFKTSQTQAPRTFIAKSVGDNPTSNYGWLVNNGSNSSNLGFAIASVNGSWGNSGSYSIQTSGITINDGNWKMATIVGDRTQSDVTIYINGVSQSLQSYVGAASFSTVGSVSNSLQFVVGAESDPGPSLFPINGSISVVQIYNRALSSQEVLQNFNAQKTRFGL